MQLDVFQNSRPIIRLHSFDRAELSSLRSDLVTLCNLERDQITLHSEPFIEARRGCRFTLRVGSRDLGIQHLVEPNLFGWLTEPGTWDPYLCELTSPSWANVVRGVDLLLQLRFLSSEYVWLHRQWHPSGTVAWLLSPTSEW